MTAWVRLSGQIFHDSGISRSGDLLGCPGDGTAADFRTHQLRWIGLQVKFEGSSGQPVRRSLSSMAIADAIEVSGNARNSLKVSLSLLFV